jgi:predicted dehydrogenase
MFTMLHQPAAQKVLRTIARGGVGELRAIHCDLFFAKGYAGEGPLARRKETAQPAPDSFLVPEAKREMFNIAVYALALIRAAAGRRAFESVHAATGNYFFDTNRRRNMEDFGVLALTLEGGITATIASGRTGWRSHPGAGHSRTRLVGTRGSLLLDASAPRIEVSGDSQLWWKVPPENPLDPMGFWASSDQRKSGGTEWTLPPVPGQSDQSAFLDCLEQGAEALCTVSDGVRILEALFAAYRSAAAGDLVRIA